MSRINHVDIQIHIGCSYKLFENLIKFPVRLMGMGAEHLNATRSFFSKGKIGFSMKI